MHTFIVILTIVVSILLVISILLQSSKGSGLAGAFGSMGATQVLGVRRTADFLSKTTSVLAGVFMVLCVLAEFTVNSEKKSDAQDSILQKNAPKQTAPVAVPSLPPTGVTPTPQQETQKPANETAPKPDEKK
jgi:preprotein translocase subunit SecG